jgi:serine phosphatase RsbU (regulator of sigma subunit)
MALGSTGPLISPALPPCTWDVASVTLGEGDHLLLYTDGVSDALADMGASGEDHVRLVVEQHPEGGPALVDTLVGLVQRQLHTDRGPDDLTLVAADVTPGSRSAPA